MYENLFNDRFAESGNLREWSSEQYKAGWESIGIIPPTKEQFNFLFNRLDQKDQYLLSRIINLESGGDNPIGYADSIASLRLVAADKVKAVEVSAYYAGSTAGGGIFYADTSNTTTADNGGTVIVGADGTRWRRLAADIQPEYFGAVGNGVADDTAALLAARDAAKAGKLTFRGVGKYKLTQVLDVREIAVDMSTAEFALSGGAQLIIGGHAGTSFNPDQSFGRVLTGSVSFNPAVYTNPSIRCIGAKGQRITVKYVDYLQFWMSTDPATYPRDSSQAYSTFNIGFAVKLSVDTDPLFDNGAAADGAGSANQWFNENIINLNRCFAFLMRGSYRHNCNYIIGGSFEGANSYIDVQSGNKNRFMHTRLEGVSFVRFSENTEGNILERSYFGSVSSIALNIDDTGLVNRVETATLVQSERQRLMDLNPFTPRWNNRPSPYNLQQISRTIRAATAFGQIAETDVFMMRGREDIVFFDFDNTSSRYQVRVFVYDINGRFITPSSLQISSGFLVIEASRFAGSPHGGQPYGTHRLMILTAGTYYVRVEIAATDNRLAGSSKYFFIDLYSSRARTLAKQKILPTTSRPTQYIGYQGDVVQYKTGRAYIDVHIQTTVAGFAADTITVPTAALGTTVLVAGDVVGIESATTGDVQWGTVVSATGETITINAAVPSWIAAGDDVYISRITAV